MYHSRVFAVAAVWLRCMLDATVRAGPLVREVASSPNPFSQVIAGKESGKEISLILDREEYDPLDVTGVAVIRIKPGGCCVPQSSPAPSITWPLQAGRT